MLPRDSNPDHYPVETLKFDVVPFWSISGNCCFDVFKTVWLIIFALLRETLSRSVVLGMFTPFVSVQLLSRVRVSRSGYHGANIARILGDDAILLLRKAGLF